MTRMVFSAKDIPEDWEDWLTHRLEVVRLVEVVRIISESRTMMMMPVHSSVVFVVTAAPKYLTQKAVARTMTTTPTD